jgi:hypothetical protein
MPLPKYRVEFLDRDGRVVPPGEPVPRALRPLGPRSPSPRNLRMSELRWVEGWTLQAIADEYGISRQRVCQITARSPLRLLDRVRKSV